jgi:hypothetical protein
MVEGYKGRIFYQRFEPGDQGEKLAREQAQVPAQRGAPSEAGKQAAKKTPLEQLEDGLREKLYAIRESNKQASFNFAPPFNAETLKISGVIRRLKKLEAEETPRAQLEEELEDKQEYLARRIESGEYMSPLLRQARDLEISQLREKIGILKGQEQRSPQLDRQEGSQRSE